MAETISPVVHGGRTRSYWLSIALHVLGATLAAAAFGAVLAGVGNLLGAPWGELGSLLIAGAAAVYLLREVFQLPIPTFDRKDQVPEWWRTFYSRPTASLLYGVGLGIGFFTYLTFGTFVVVAVAAFLSGSAAVGALLSAAFGAARSLILVGADETNGLHPDLLERLASTSTPRWVNAAALLSVAAIAVIVV